MKNFKVIAAAEENIKLRDTVGENVLIDQEDAGHTNAGLNVGFASTEALGFICQSSACNEPVQIKIEGQSQQIGLELGSACRLEHDDLEFDGSGEPDIGVKIPEVTTGSFADKLGLRTVLINTKTRNNDRLIEVRGQRVTSREKAIEAFSSSTDKDLKVTVQRYETNTNEVKQCEISPEKGTIVTEVIDCDAVTKTKSVCVDDNLTLDNDIGSEQVYLKNSGPDRSLYLVVEENNLLLRRDIADDDLNKYALFKLHRYLDLCFSYSESAEYEPVVIQHQETGLCVKLENDAVELTKISNLEKVPKNSPFMFRRKIIDHNQNVAFFRIINKKKLFISFSQDKADGSAAMATRSPDCFTSVFCP